MNYQKIYNQLLERAKNRTLEGYIEKHHIIPKCIGGPNNKENLVELTAREHFLSHLLLCEIYPENIKLKNALFLMAIGKRKIKNNHYKISSRTYERLKLEKSKMMLGNTNHLGKPRSELTKRKIGDSNRKPKPKGFGKKPEGFGEKISKSWEHKVVTWGDKISKGNKGISRGKGIKRPNSGGKKPILQLDLNENLIKEWKSETDAANYLNKKSSSSINMCCSGKRKTAYGFKWKNKL